MINFSNTNFRSSTFQPEKSLVHEFSLLPLRNLMSNLFAKINCYQIFLSQNQSRNYTHIKKIATEVEQLNNSMQKYLKKISILTKLMKNLERPLNKHRSAVPEGMYT